MAKANFVRNKFFDPSRERKSVALVDVDGVLVEVAYWADIIEQMGKEDAKLYIICEALISTGNVADVHALLKTDAKGTLTFDESNVTIDTRNWQQKYLQENPIKPKPAEDFDPFAD